MILLLCVIWAIVLPERLIFPMLLTLIWLWDRTRKEQ